MAKASPPQKKKILENPVLASAVVPTAIVLVGVLIIWGMTQLLSGEKNYRELVEEMNSRTFGNRWVAAFELSKVLANKKVPPEEIPWLVDNLKKIYGESVDPRTRNFIIMALASVASPTDITFLEKAVADPDPQVKFNAVVSLGNFSSGLLKNAGPLLTLLEGSDEGLAQASAFALAHHQVQAAVPKLRQLLQASGPGLKYAAATALIAFKDESAVPTLRQILLEANLGAQFNPEQTLNLKLRVVNALRTYQWKVLNDELGSVAENGTNLKLSTNAQAALNFLKN